MKYSFGVSWKGLLVIVLLIIPNAIFALFPDLMPISNSFKDHLPLDIIEHGTRAIYIALLISLRPQKEASLKKSYILPMTILLLAYYSLWLALLTGNHSFIVLLGMAIVPVIFLIFAELWLNIYPAILPTVIFGIIHVIITYIDYK
ncbi:MAG TPA: hypothetical protein GX731_05525 [Clostridiales bacterium]|nr:hypothetical protein [Clostridiales bacterium]